jgi:hypothetical protein
MNKRIFPIVTDTACQYKWSWSTVFLSRGTTASCHRCKHWPITPETFMDFHNHPGKIADREKMLAGEWPGNGCEYCRDVELAGGESERSSLVNSMNLVPPELATEPRATRVTPRLLEVYFSNLCNQACVYCSPQFSSSIQQEYEKHGPIVENDSYFNFRSFAQDIDYPALKAKFWEWMELHGHELYQFQVLGGEPLYQDEFEECLDFFAAHPNQNLHWEIFSNLKHDTEKLKVRLDKIKALITERKIKSFRIVCSFDCWGEQAEFVRYGTDLAKWERNFGLLLDTDKIDIHVHSTLTALTVETFGDLMDKIAGWSAKKSVTHSVNTVRAPAILDIYAFGPALVEEMDAAVRRCHDDSLRTILGGIRACLESSKPDGARLGGLGRYLDELDRRRGTEWRRLYPNIARKIAELSG